MSQRPQPDFPIDPQQVNGTELAGILNRMETAISSGNSGTSRPAYLGAGGMWVNTGGSQVALMLFDGTKDWQVWPDAGGTTPSPEPVPPPESVGFILGLGKNVLAQNRLNIETPTISVNSKARISNTGVSLKTRQNGTDFTEWNDQWKIGDHLLIYHADNPAEYARLAVTGRTDRATGVQLNYSMVSGVTHNFADGDFITVARQSNATGTPTPVAPPPHDEHWDIVDIVGTEFDGNPPSLRFNLSQLNSNMYANNLYGMKFYKVSGSTRTLIGQGDFIPAGAGFVMRSLATVKASYVGSSGNAISQQLQALSMPDSAFFVMPHGVQSGTPTIIDETFDANTDYQIDIEAKDRTTANHPGTGNTATLSFRIGKLPGVSFSFIITQAGAEVRVMTHWKD